MGIVGIVVPVYFRTVKIYTLGETNKSAGIFTLIPVGRTDSGVNIRSITLPFSLTHTVLPSSTKFDPVIIKVVSGDPAGTAKGLI